MKRREFLCMLLLNCLAAERGIAADKESRIGYLVYQGIPQDIYTAHLRIALCDVGWCRERQAKVLVRAVSNVDDLVGAADDLVRSDVDVIIAVGASATYAAKAATTRIPIVFTYTQDPIARGLVASHSRPESNLTGFALSDETLLKLLQFLRELKPDARTAGYLFDPANTPRDALTVQLRELVAAAEGMGLRLNPLPVAHRDQIAAVIPQAKENVDAIIVESTPMFMSNVFLVPTLAKRHKLIALYRERSFVTAEGLLSYGENVFQLQRQAAGYVDRLLRGAQVRELPIQQATRIELAINLKTARAFGLEFPSAILARADEVID